MVEIEHVLDKLNKFENFVADIGNLEWLWMTTFTYDIYSIWIFLIRYWQIGSRKNQLKWYLWTDQISCLLILILICLYESNFDICLVKMLYYSREIVISPSMSIAKKMSLTSYLLGQVAPVRRVIYLNI